MARTAGFTYCPMTNRKLGVRTPLLAGYRRRKAAKKYPHLVTWFYPPTLPTGYRGDLK